jgi:hypothetical protein
MRYLFLQIAIRFFIRQKRQLPDKISSSRFATKKHRLKIFCIKLAAVFFRRLLSGPIFSDQSAWLFFKKRWGKQKIFGIFWSINLQKNFVNHLFHFIGDIGIMGEIF